MWTVAPPRLKDFLGGAKWAEHKKNTKNHN